MSGIQQGLLASYKEQVVQGLPEGTLLLFDRPGAAIPIPTGFELLLSIDGENLENFAIRGATAFSKNATTPAPVSLVPGVYTTGPAGDHPATPPLITGPATGSVGGQPQGAQTIIGAHTHSVTVTGTPSTFPNGGEISAGNQQGMRIPLIKATTNVLQVPAGAIIFSGTSTVFTNFSRKSWPALQPASPQPSAAGMYTVNAAVGPTAQNETIPFPASITAQLNGSPQFSVAPAGNHQHSGLSPAPGGPNPSPTTPNATRHLSGGIHTHTASPTTTVGPNNAFGVGVWKQFKHLLPVIATTNQDVQSGMIVMYSGTSVPPGWLLCDGTNGTPNMVDFFIGYNNALSTSNNVVGNNAIGGSMPASAGPTLGPGWPTTPAPVGGPVTQLRIGWSLLAATNPHSHMFNLIRATSLRSMGHATKNDPHQHPGDSSPLGLLATMPADYLPKHLAVIFMQKA